MIVDATCREFITALQGSLAITETVAAVLPLALAAVSSSAQINDSVMEIALTHLATAEIVEIVVWLSILQMLHRLNCYYDLIKTG